MCLGWGSLIWRPEQLRIKGAWNVDGPAIAVEYLRQSKNGCLTLVINKGENRIPVLWAEMDFIDPHLAKENLREREGWIKEQHVGFWQLNSQSPTEIPGLDVWAKAKRAEAVIWTALPPKFNGEDYQIPALEEAMSYLENLDRAKKVLAEEYVRKTPAQITTPFRKEIEMRFGWARLD